MTILTSIYYKNENSNIYLLLPSGHIYICGTCHILVAVCVWVIECAKNRWPSPFIKLAWQVFTFC